MSTLIRNGHLLDLERRFEPADILVEGGRIVRVGHNLPDSAQSIIDASGKVVMPGLINGHTHSGQILDRGMAENCPLDLWLLYAGLGGQPLSEQELYSLAAWSALIQLKTGCTACLDHASVRPDRFSEASEAIAQAYVDSGFRAAVAPSVGDMDFFATLPTHLLEGETRPSLGRDIPRASDLLAAVRRFLRSWQGRNALVQPYVGPGAPQRSSEELLDGCFQLSEEFDSGIHTHLLEARSQWFACEKRFGGSAAGYFNRKGWMTPRLSCAHCVWLSESEAELFAESGACIAHNPVSNLRLGSGIFNLQMALAKGAPVALGADGAASNDSQNMWEVLKLTAILHDAYGTRDRWVTARDALRLCWEGGARLLRQQVGAIKAGYQADLVVLGGPELFIRPKEQMIASLVYGELGQSVDTVLVAGEVVLSNRKLTKVDETRLHDEAAAIVEQRCRQMPEREAFYTAQKGYVERLLAASEEMDGPPVRTAVLD